jgi:phosphoribosylformimino-5-aminoimidazole carboxamide ribotide isomerase
LRVIPVLDLRAGRAVLARGGRRDTYAAVRSVLTGTGGEKGEGAGAGGGDPVPLARAYIEDLGCDECYIADLDAIAGARVQGPLLRQLAGLGAALWIDAAVTEPARARGLIRLGAARVIVGLETLSSVRALAAVLEATGPERVVFSLDLRDGAPVVRPGVAARATPLDLARAAIDAGVTSLLVLDVARVGSGRGVDDRLVSVLRAAHPDVQLFAGGGIASVPEIERLADLGLDGVLVATALHDGRLRRADLEAVRRRHPSDSR